AVGVWASLVLLVARLVQGLAHGGELPSSQTYLSEIAPKEHRGYWATLIYTSGTVGILFGTLLGAVLNMALSPEVMNAWGWRIPFLIGAAMGLYALIMRSRLHESDVFEGESLRRNASRSGRRSSGTASRPSRSSASPWASQSSTTSGAWWLRVTPPRR
ncbi:putative proline/betaine transporter, partial [Arthrobacter sp. Hiyo6]